MTTAYIAVDLGAESGRVIIGILENQRLRLEEVHRFMHESVWLPTGLHWDTTGIWREIVVGLRKAADWGRANKIELRSVGVDAWGVDWALVDKAGDKSLYVWWQETDAISRGDAQWQEVVAVVVERLKVGDLVGGLCCGIEASGTLLARACPARDGDNPDELSNQVIQDT